jgi:hypothetical protein
MKTKTVEYQDGELEVRIVVQEADGLAGMRRSVLRSAGSAYLDSIGDGGDDGEGKLSALEMTSRRLMAFLLYPDLLGSAKEIEGLDPDLDVEEFFALPERLINVWQAATYALNPHWLQSEPEDEEEADELKKDSQSSDSESEPSS